jgi:hypothetical protein
MRSCRRLPSTGKSCNKSNILNRRKEFLEKNSVRADSMGRPISGHYPFTCF